MEYISRMMRPFSDRSNTNGTKDVQLKKKDIKQTHDPQIVLLYLKQISISMLTQQNVNMSYLNPNYLAEIQDVINSDIRASAIDELYRMCVQHNYQKRTFHQAVYLFDVFLSANRIQTAQITLILKTCFFIAAKYEEIYPRPLWKYVQDRIEMETIFNYEKDLLQLIDFKLITSSAYVWLNYYWTIIIVVEKTQNWFTYASLLIDIALYQYNILKFEPSKIACASLYTSSIMLNLQINWNQLATQFGLHFLHEIKEASNLISIQLKSCVTQKREIVKHMCMVTEKENVLI